MKKFSIAIAAALFVLASGTQAFGSSIVAYSDPGGSGTQSWTGNLALDFTVNSAINVTALGVYDTDGPGALPLGSSVTVAIFDSSNTEVVGPVTFTGSTRYTVGAAGFDIFQTVSSVTLAPGTYSVDVLALGHGFLNGNQLFTPSAGPALTGDASVSYDGASWDSNNTIDNPSTCVYCGSPSTSQFDAGTFEYSSATVTPEPGTLFLMGSGALGLAGMVRRKFRKVAA